MTTQNSSMWTFLTKATVKPHCVVVSDKIVRAEGEKANRNAKSDDNLIRTDEYNGYLSKAAERLIKRRLDTWLTSIALNNDLATMAKQVNVTQVFPTFITLTLASKQVHFDNLIKNEILDPFLEWLRGSEEELIKYGPRKGEKKGFGVKAYLWRGEAQKNGNVHFHIVADRYIPWERVREKWNQCQERLGYVTRYRYVQEFKHRNGFRIDEQAATETVSKLAKAVAAVKRQRKVAAHVSDDLRPLLEKVAKTGHGINKQTLRGIAVNRQRQAYEQGVKENWSNPNSTDIHRVENLESITAYITKYVTKPAEEMEHKLGKNQVIVEENGKKYIETKHVEYYADEEFATITREEYVPKYLTRFLDGRIWGCSDTLRPSKDKETKKETDLFVYPSFNLLETNIVYDESKQKGDRVSRYCFDHRIDMQEYLTTLKATMKEEDIKVVKQILSDGKERIAATIYPMRERQDKVLANLAPDIGKEYKEHYRTIYEELYGKKTAA